MLTHIDADTDALSNLQGSGVLLSMLTQACIVGVAPPAARGTHAQHGVCCVAAIGGPAVLARLVLTDRGPKVHSSRQNSCTFGCMQ